MPQTDRPRLRRRRALSLHLGGVLSLLVTCGCAQSTAPSFESICAAEPGSPEREQVFERWQLEEARRTVSGLWRSGAFSRALVERARENDAYGELPDTYLAGLYPVVERWRESGPMAVRNVSLITDRVDYRGDWTTLAVDGDVLFVQRCGDALWIQRGGYGEPMFGVTRPETGLVIATGLDSSQPHGVVGYLGPSESLAGVHFDLGVRHEETLIARRAGACRERHTWAGVVHRGRAPGDTRLCESSPEREVRLELHVGEGTARLLQYVGDDGEVVELTGTATDDCTIHVESGESGEAWDLFCTDDGGCVGTSLERFGSRCETLWNIQGFLEDVSERG